MYGMVNVPVPQSTVDIDIPKTSWVQSGTVYTNTINYQDATIYSKPYVDGIVYSSTPTDSDRKAALKAASLIYQMETLNGQLKFYATAIPQTNLTIRLRGL